MKSTCAPARTQSTLFEVMEERQVSIDGHQHNLDFPFSGLATQNPIEMEGTYVCLKHNSIVFN